MAPASPTVASSRRNLRPSTGRTPSVSKNVGVTTSPYTRSTGPSPASTFTKASVYASRLSKERAIPFQSTKFGGETLPRSRPRSCTRSHTTTMRSGAAYGNGRSSTAFTMLKTETLTAIPSASVATITAVRRRSPTRARAANRRSRSTPGSLRERDA